MLSLYNIYHIITLSFEIFHSFSHHLSILCTNLNLYFHTSNMSVFIQCSVFQQFPSDFELQQGSETKHFGYCHFLAHLMVKPNTLNIAINGDRLERLNNLLEISLSLSKLKQRVESNIKNLRCVKNKLLTAWRAYLTMNTAYITA
jgi:hypothetical protein